MGNNRTSYSSGSRIILWAGYVKTFMMVLSILGGVIFFIAFTEATNNILIAALISAGIIGSGIFWAFVIHLLMRGFGESVRSIAEIADQMDDLRACIVPPVVPEDKESDLF